MKQARAELGQAQLKLELRFTLIKGLLHYIDDYKLPLHITEHDKSVILVTSTYLHNSLLNCQLPCLLSYLLSYKPPYIEDQTVLQ